MSERVLLLVDDEENILRSLTRLLRRDGYTLLSATGGAAALELLSQHPEVAVIITDQRMPGMTGSELLSEVKQRWPHTVRLMLSGYTDLHSVTDAINRGAIYKFLTKPWEDELLRDNIREAFEHYELRAENRRLTTELQAANEALGRRLADQSRTLGINQRVLEVSQEILEQLPVGVLGIDEDGMVAVANEAAHGQLGAEPGSLIGRTAAEVVPPQFLALPAQMGGATLHRQLDHRGRPISVHCARLGLQSAARGSLLVLSPEECP